MHSKCDPREGGLDIGFEARKILYERPQFFLERFGHLLSEEELHLFENLSEEVTLWLEKLRRRIQDVPTKVRMRRRKEYLRQARLRSDGYFSEQEMADREPELFEELLGQFGYVMDQRDVASPGPVTAALLEHLDRSLRRPEDDIGDLHRETRDGSSVNSDFRAEMFEVAAGKRDSSASERGDLSPSKRARVEQTWNSYVQECQSDERNEVAPAPPNGNGKKLTADELEARRLDFLSQMEENFLNGFDDFDYREIDESSLYDDADAVRQDAEDDYFS